MTGESFPIWAMFQLVSSELKRGVFFEGPTGAARIMSSPGPVAKFPVSKDKKYVIYAEDGRNLADPGLFHNNSLHNRLAISSNIQQA